jgi:predicted Zn-dependent protease
MKPVRGYYYDGRSSARYNVELECDGSTLMLRGEGVDISFPVAAIRISPRVGDARRSIRFPNEALCEIIDHSSLENLLGKAGENPLQMQLFRWERSNTLVLLALLLTIVVIAGFIRYGSPEIARQVAYAVPPASEATLGRESLAFLDKSLMKPSKLPESRRQEVTALFGRMKESLPGAKEYRIEFRDSEQIGANAFALPGGTIIVTDAMIALVRSDEELAGILAHESGHVHSRHVLRQVLQSTGIGLLIAAVTGDITSITSLSATIPTALINAGYSRDFENEADDAAVTYLTKADIQPKIYADTLARLQAEHDKKTGKKSDSHPWSPMDLLSTHPVTSERIRRVLAPHHANHN